MKQWNQSFTDTETTGLDVRKHDLWEVALGRRAAGSPYTEGVYQFRVDLTNAEPEALKINHYYDRFAVPDGYDAAYIAFDGTPEPMSVRQAISELQTNIRNSVLIGSNVQFDMQFLLKLLGPDLWHYRPINAVELAVGWLMANGEHIELPWSSTEIAQMVGVPPIPEDEAHTALADMRWARDVFDKVYR